MNRRPAVALWAALCALGSLAHAQDDPFRRLPVRVLSTLDDGTLVVDRGRRDQVEIDDLVLFLPGAGAMQRGSVVRIEDRSAVVRPQQRGVQLPAGTRGEVLIPKTRGARPDPTPTPTPADPEAAQQPDAQPDDRPAEPRWANRDPDWQPGDPLLDAMRPVRPEDRGASYRGRIWFDGQMVDAGDDLDTNSLARLGADVSLENPFGKGGRIHVDGELICRNELLDDQGVDLLFRELSYAVGGDRFSRQRVEFGRFLQRGIPEFGYLDGVEYEYRAGEDDEHRFGGSLGFMPVPDDDFESFDDFQAAGYWAWTTGHAQEFEFRGGFQKTWHKGETDRDLFILKSRYLPSRIPDANPWDLQATVWIDLYTGSDQVKGDGVEITQAFVSSGRDFDDGSRVEFGYRRVRFPEIDRNEFLPIQQAQLADNRYDRLTFDWWQPLAADGPQLETRLAVWSDERTEGAAGEVGLVFNGWLVEGSRTRIALFADDSDLGFLLGGRGSFDVFDDSGSWNLLYEYFNQHIDGMPSDRDDIAQQRLELGRSFTFEGGLSTSLTAGAVRWDDELHWRLGVFLQQSF